MKGTLIVLEGTDGCGKSTQLRMLCQRLERESIPFRQVEFPRYSSLSSGPVRMYLNGAFGSSPSDVNAYAASSFYAVDRYASYKEDWAEWYQRGGLVICGRYTTSNAIHQASKMPLAEQEVFFRWLYDFEFDKLGLPAPDLVLYLDLPTGLTVDLMRRREAETNTHGDIHERDTAYLAACRQTARHAASVLNWQQISCADEGGQRVRPIEEIHEDIWRNVRQCALRHFSVCP